VSAGKRPKIQPQKARKNCSRAHLGWCGMINGPILIALAIYATAILFMFGAFRLAGRADDASQKLADQLADRAGLGDFDSIHSRPDISGAAQDHV
jgi:hypothetical protein